MSLTSLIFSVSLFWAAIHVAHAYYFKRGRLSSTLPLTGGTARSRSRLTLTASSSSSSSAWQVSLKGLRLQVSTTAWNEAHDNIAGSLLRRKNRKLLDALRAVYNVGVGAAAFGMIVACVGLLWVLGSSVLRWVAGGSVSGSSNLGHQLSRRDLGFDGVSSEGVDKSKYKYPST